MNSKTFISEALVPRFEEPGIPQADAGVLSGTRAVSGAGIPSAFEWRGETLRIKEVTKAWRTTKNDRGDDYLARLWYELETEDGRHLTVYFDRKARPEQPRWWLYTIATSTPAR